MYKYTLSVLIASAVALSLFVFEMGCVGADVEEGESGEHVAGVVPGCDAGADAEVDAYHDPEFATCDDGIMNHGETDVDCGGWQFGVSVNDCPACVSGRHCLTDNDCASAVCLAVDPTTSLDNTCL